jgi:hypothetical protein
MKRVASAQLARAQDYPTETTLLPGIIHRAWSLWLTCKIALGHKINALTSGFRCAFHPTMTDPLVSAVRVHHPLGYAVFASHDQSRHLDLSAGSRPCRRQVRVKECRQSGPIRPTCSFGGPGRAIGGRAPAPDETRRTTCGAASAAQRPSTGRPCSRHLVISGFPDLDQWTHEIHHRSRPIVSMFARQRKAAAVGLGTMWSRRPSWRRRTAPCPTDTSDPNSRKCRVDRVQISRTGPAAPQAALRAVTGSMPTLSVARGTLPHPGRRRSTDRAPWPGSGRAPLRSSRRADRPGLSRSPGPTH